mmetsp:Transcript_16771/g.27556  ORF Transcript_16771/g.27556 Transcript_16771/m.27556 type:complete len:570 (-) Transcript_16771:420-2129(-)
MHLPTTITVEVWLLVLLLLPASSSAHDVNKSPVVCDAEQRIFCPPATSCCPTFKSRREPDVVVGYSCLMGWSSRFPRGPCCPHYEDEIISKKLDVSSWRGGTGCGNGYECGVSSIGTPNCVVNSTAHPTDYDGKQIKNKYDSMPRYRACKSFAKDGVEVFGLPIPLSAALSYKSSSSLTNADELTGHYMGQLAYYSSMGRSIADNRVNSDIKTAIIGVHGSGRDAGTYLCALTSLMVDASKERSFLRGQRRNLNPKDVLVVAPWFMAPVDDSPLPSSSLPYLQWDAQYPIFHTWRYGAESISDVNHNNVTISSFGAMDVLLESLCDRKRFPRLRRVVLVGHSAGGQFVQRWALSSSSWCFGGGQFASRWAKTDLPHVRVVVANPRSFAYLDNRRYFISEQAAGAVDYGMSPAENDGTLTPFDKYQLRPPSASEEDGCKEFNRYEWGLDENEKVPAPYVINNVQKLIDHGDNSDLFCRYASRDIVYLSGQRDVETLGSQICGKGREDGYQGPSRRERSERFFAALQLRGGEVEFCRRETKQVHDRHVVKNVGHDHALIFQSPEGIQAIFG